MKQYLKIVLPIGFIFFVILLIFYQSFSSFFNPNDHLNRKDIGSNNNVIPQYKPSDIFIAVSDSLPGISQDKENYISQCKFYQYDLKGMYPKPGEKWIIDSNYCSSAKYANDPFYALCELLDVYKSQSKEKLLGIYTKESSKNFQKIFAKKDVEDRFFRLTKNFNKFEVMLISETDIGIKLFVKINSSDEPVPYLMKEEDGKLKFVSAQDFSVTSTNLLTAFYYHRTNLHNLFIKKDLDSDNIINRKDNCPCGKNEPQEDGDNDGIGDKCDSCPSIANEDQSLTCKQLLNQKNSN